MAVYVVKAGDTLSAIADRFNTTVAAIAATNHIFNPNVLSVGEELIIPEGPGHATYMVQPGDTLSAIAARFQTTVAALSRANNLSDPDLIRVGQVLVIPVAEPSQPVTPGTLRAQLQRVVDLGRAQGWKPYSGPIVDEPDTFRWGNPGFDCSSFVSSMYLQALGIHLPGFTDAIAEQTDTISTAEAVPGDIILYRYDDSSQPNVTFPHTGLWLGDGTMLDCQCTGDPDLHHPGLGVHPLLSHLFEVHRARNIPLTS